MIFNFGVGKDSSKFLGLQGDQTSQSWVFIGRTMLKLKLQYFGHMMQRTDSLEKPLMLGKIEGRRRREWQRMRWLDGITNSIDRVRASSRSWWWDRETWRAAVLVVAKSQTQLRDWIDMWNVEKWYRLTYLQARNRDAGIENGCVGTVGGVNRINWETRIDVWALPCVKQTVGGNLLCSLRLSAWCSLVI